METWKTREVTLQSEATQKKYEADLATWKEKVAEAKAAGKPAPRGPRSPSSLLEGNARPGNIFAGMVHPTLGYGMKGVIWYQGESNAGRAHEYRSLFPYMIEQWRKEWGQGDFPFYWVQLADYLAEASEPSDSAWAELREAQTMTLALPNTGQAVIIDAGEGRDIHPRDKTTVANRLVRLALANDYGYPIDALSPRYASMQVKDSAIALTFDHVSRQGLCSFDIKQPIGFAIAGEDQIFVKADAKIIGKNKVLVSNVKVSKPVAVRYAWANNPKANLQDRNGLPVTPFRTDDWPGITANSVK